MGVVTDEHIHPARLAGVQVQCSWVWRFQVSVLPISCADLLATNSVYPSRRLIGETPYTAVRIALAATPVSTPFHL